MFLREVTSLREPRAKTLSYLYVSLSNICNARCVYCDVHSAPAPAWRYGESEVRTALVEANDLGCRTVHFLGGGEPLVDPRFRAAAEVCGRLGLKVVITTNGSHLEQQLRGALIRVQVDTIVVSLDSHRADLHDEVRGVRGLFGRALGGIRCAQERTPGTRVVLNHVVTRTNIGDLQEFLSFAASVEACAVNLIPVKDRFDMAVENGAAHSLAERFEEARRTARGLGLELLFDPASVAERTTTSAGRPVLHEYRCLFPYHALYIDFPSGDAFPCDCTIHRQPRSRFMVGNVRRQSLADIWTGKPIEDLRRVLESPCDPGCKRDCDWNNVRTNADLIQLRALPIQTVVTGLV
jgi:MoaA/NifB/PqqE/SkfB family radical SAM enzyme